ncbi:hypothetical protein [Paraburkholderia sp.]|uniref:hypothetical protein n=1 Tax=Paraburkholderia sp. TaxID=1926495 RepID=UPI0039E266C3
MQHISSRFADAAKEILCNFQARMHQSVQMYAGCNVMSPAAEHALANSMGMIPAIGAPHAKLQPGTKEISDLEELVEGQLQDLFDGEWSECRLQSCTYANMAVYLAFSRVGDSIATISAPDGGHVSHQATGTIGMLGRTAIRLPFDYSRCSVDDQAAAALIKVARPSIVMLGGSVMLAPYNTRELVVAAHAVGAVVVYDASHVAGLIAGGRFQNPMAMGIDIMTASTYKTLGGPSGGILVGNKKSQGDLIRKLVTGSMASNYDAGRLLALSTALSEAKAFMGDYADAMLKNSAVLSRSLEGFGIPLHHAPIDQPAPTHQALVLCSSPESAKSLVTRAEAIGLLFGAAPVPGRPTNGGVRLGTQAITRLGVTETEIAKIAEVFAAAWRGEDVYQYQSDIVNIASRLNRVYYTYDNNSGTL